MRTAFRKTAFLLAGGMLLITMGHAQELYVFTQPASNMPAHSISGKLSAGLLRNKMQDRVTGRITPEVMFGLSKKWMVHGSFTLSDMYTKKVKWESEKLYVKYRLYSSDAVHHHFRMAVFGEASHSTASRMYDEISFDGDNSGARGGMVFTQLTGKAAFSSTVSYLHTLGDQSKRSAPDFPDQALNYTLSAGYLVLPVRYRSFDQANLNVYTELLGQQSLDQKKYTVDLAPSLQLILNSNMKLNVGYRFQLDGNMDRMSRQSWMVSFERTFFNAF